MPAERLGIVAGAGQFPVLCARAARTQGIKVFAVAHRGETDTVLESEADKTCWVHLGQLGRLIGFFKKHDVTEVIFAGAITKKRMFHDIRPDLRGITAWKRIKSRLDDGILRAVADELARDGITVVASTLYLKELLTPQGVLTRTAPDSNQLRDIEFGVSLAREIGRLDIGQCVVVKDRAVVAVEAMEGTDRTILRGGELAGPGAVVIKICKPGQDTRFDLPATGVQTIETMKRAGASCLALDAGRSLLFDREKTLGLADSYGIAVMGIENKLSCCTAHAVQHPLA